MIVNKFNIILYKNSRKLERDCIEHYSSEIRPDVKYIYRKVGYRHYGMFIKIHDRYEQI
jgi:hypothetical protein